jgi:transcriptional regulator with XRE-family HTH domain
VLNMNKRSFSNAPPQKPFGLTIETARLTRKTRPSREQIAQRLGGDVGQSAVRNWELSAGRPPDYGMVNKIADVLSIPRASLMPLAIAERGDIVLPAATVPHIKVCTVLGLIWDTATPEQLATLEKACLAMVPK